jgi:hypothetical protein
MVSFEYKLVKVPRNFWLPVKPRSKIPGQKAVGTLIALKVEANGILFQRLLCIECSLKRVVIQSPMKKS